MAHEHCIKVSINLLIVTSLHFAEKRPRRLIVLFAVAPVKRGDILDGALHWAARLGIVGDGAIELLPGRSALDLSFPGLAVEAHTCEAAVCCEHDAPIGVLPGVGLIALQDRELDAVNGLELV